MSATSSKEPEPDKPESILKTLEEKNEKGMQHGVRFGKGRYVSAITVESRTHVKSIMQSKVVSVKENDTVPGVEARNECDTHADTGVAGCNCRVLEFTGEVCEVSGFNDKFQTLKNIPVANVATAYTIPETGETVILVLNQMLWFGKQMAHTLINPNQL